MIHILCEEARKNSMYDHPEFVDPMWIIIGSFPEKCNFPWKRKFFSPPLLSVFWRGERLPTFRRWYGIRSLFFKIPSGPPCIAEKLLLKTNVKQKGFFLKKNYLGRSAWQSRVRQFSWVVREKNKESMRSLLLPVQARGGGVGGGGGASAQ